MEKIHYQMDIIEKDYFGLQYTDHNHVSHWLDPSKPVKKQVKSKTPQKLEIVESKKWSTYLPQPSNKQKLVKTGFTVLYNFIKPSIFSRTPVHFPNASQVLFVRT